MVVPTGMIERNETLSWSSVVQPIENITDRVGISWNTVSHLHGVKDSDAFREAFSKVTFYCILIISIIFILNALEYQIIWWVGLHGGRAGKQKTWNLT